MPGIRLANLVKTYRVGRQATGGVNRVNLDVPDGKIVTLLGPSGCGKSTTLRCIAGLERPDDGEILFDDRLLFSRSRRISVPPERRNVGMVFQSYAIWPHLTVFQNVAYPLEVRGMPSRQVAERVRDVLALVGLSGLEDRPGPFLSGGQQQRVVLARALVYRPEVLLLDEPLSNLDAKVREQVREELRGLQRRLGITTLYVTHDQLEALALSDIVAVMQHGRIVELGTPQDLYARPRSPFTAAFLGEISYVTGTVASVNGGAVMIETAFGPLSATSADHATPGASVVAAVRPEHVRLSRQRPPDGNVLAGKVLTALFEGTRVKYRVALGDTHLLAYGTEFLSVDEGIYAGIDPRNLILLPHLPAD
ncbi:MAG TPA: ABC transporter ATP-binding protein [bacterium]|nr:ABC transporter ATP-binding protein [bacterium]